MKTLGVKVLSVLLLALFVGNQCDLFYATVHLSAKAKTGGTCSNTRCCCDHSRMNGKESKCNMCSPPVTETGIPTSQCCLRQAGCDPAANLPVPATNKDVQFPSVTAKIALSINTETVALENSILRLIDFKNSIFHPPIA